MELESLGESTLNGANDAGGWQALEKIEYAKHKGYTSRRRISALDMNVIQQHMKDPCSCERKCYELLDVKVVLRWRKKVHLLPMGFNQKQKLLDLYRETLFTEGHNKTLHLCESNLLCRKAWFYNLLGISESTYTRIKSIVKSGVHCLYKPDRKSRGCKGEAALGFMNYYVGIMGDPSPSGDRILMPVGVTVQEIFRQYIKNRMRQTCIKESQFYMIWKKNFVHVSYQKYCRISKCNTCMLSKHLLEQNLSPSAHEAVLNDRDEHLIRQQTERRAYYKRREEAIEQPNYITSIIIDGMDQAKTNLPHFKGWTNPKELDQANLLQTHVVGAIVHGQSTYSLIDFNQYPHDANLTLNSLMKVLLQEAKDCTLTRTLYVQLDNCSRENKNKYFLGFMPYLVVKGYLNEVIMSFLMVGHTHEDIDAKFSKISQALAKFDAKTWPELHKIIEKSTSAKMIAQLNDSVYNIRDWLVPHLNEIHNHTKPHVYRIYRDGNGHGTIVYKNWSTDKDWYPLDSVNDKIEIFKLINGKQSLPTGIPDLVLPDHSRKNNTEMIKKNIDNLKLFLNYQEYSWWNDYFANPNASDENPTWYLDKIKHCIGENDASGELSEEQTSSPLCLSMEKERKVPHVFSGKRQKKNNENMEISLNDQIKVFEITTGYMVAIIEADELTVGEVTHIGDNFIVMTLYEGSLNDPWKICKMSNGSTFSKKITKDLVNEDLVFVLTKNGKIPGTVKEKINTMLSKVLK